MIKAIQKVITIGTSLGVTLPMDDLNAQGIKKGDKIELWFTKANTDGMDKDIKDEEKDD